MAQLTTLASGSSVTLSVSEQQFIVLENGRSDVARLTIATGSGAGTVVTAQHNGRRVYGPFAVGTITLAAVSGDVRYELSGDTVSELSDDDGPLSGAETSTVRSWVARDATVAGTYTWATLPAAADYIGTAYITDVGPSGSLWRSDGSTWGIVGGSVVLARGNTNLTVTAASTAEVDLVSLTIPAGLIGANGQIVVTHFWEMTNSGNNKTMRVKLGATAFFANVQTAALIYLPPPTRIWNRNSEASQIAFAAANGNVTVSTGTAATTGTVDTAAATTLVISGQKATGAETLILYAYTVDLIRP